MLPTEGQAHITMATWHRRLGHPTFPLMRSIVKHSSVKGLTYQDNHQLTVMHALHALRSSWREFRTHGLTTVPPGHVSSYTLT